jgi:hypothetical protein
MLHTVAGRLAGVVALVALLWSCDTGAPASPVGGQVAVSAAALDLQGVGDVV